MAHAGLRDGVGARGGVIRARRCGAADASCGVSFAIDAHENRARRLLFVDSTAHDSHSVMLRMQMQSDSRTRSLHLECPREGRTVHGPHARRSHSGGRGIPGKRDAGDRFPAMARCATVRRRALPRDRAPHAGRPLVAAAAQPRLAGKCLRERTRIRKEFVHVSMTKDVPAAVEAIRAAREANAEAAETRAQPMAMRAATKKAPAKRKPAARKATAKKPATRKAAPKRATAAKKAAPKRTAAKKPATRRAAAAKKPAARKTATRKTAAKKPATRRAAAAKKPAARRTAARKPAVRRPRKAPASETPPAPASETPSM
jgi:hypothetical protein